MNLYVYYRVRPINTVKVRSLITQLQTRAANRAGVRLKLMKRQPASQEGIETWMEIYENVPANFEFVLAEVVRDLGISDYIMGQRKLERFNEI